MRDEVVPRHPRATLRTAFRGARRAALCAALAAVAALPGAAEWRPIPAAAEWRESSSALDGSLAFLAEGKGLLVAGVERTGLFVSRDGGLSWSQAAAGSPTSAATAGGRIYVCGDFPDLAQFLVSPDGGATWESRRFAVRDAAGEAVPTYAFLTCVAAAESAAGGPVLVAGSLDGVYVSRDGGLSFEQSQGGLPKPLRAFSASAGGGALFVGSDQGLFVSRDGGGTWSRADLGAAGPVLRAYARGDACLASVQVDGEFVVCASDDGGRAWRTVGSGEAECVAFADLGPGGAPVAAFDDYRTAALAPGANALTDIVTIFPRFAGGPGSRDDYPTALLGAGGFLYMGSSDGRLYRLPAAGAAPRAAP